MKPIQWLGEACDLPAEPATGTYVTRMTAAIMANINIYGEQPYTTPDGRRIAILRSPYADPRMPPAELCVADLVTLRLAVIEENVLSILVATSGYSGVLLYLDGERRLMRVNLATLEREALFPWTLPEHVVFESATPDGRYLVGTVCEPDFHSAIVRVDLRTGRAETIFRHPEILCHVQVHPGHGRDILIQLNRGSGRNHEGEARPVENPLTGATHFIIDLDGGSLRPLAIGEPHTKSSSGHSGWIADAGRIGVSTHFAYLDPRTPGALDARYPQGNFFTVGPGEDKPTVFAAPGHRFNHVNVSRDGRYFVCDCYHKGLPGGIELVVGNLATGRCRALLEDCGAQGGCAASSHPHPYLTADNRHVIYNADPHGVPHVHAAHVTEEFLKSLE